MRVRRTLWINRKLEPHRPATSHEPRRFTRVMRRTLALTALVAALLIPLRPGAEAADRSKARAFSLHVPQPGGVVSAAGFLWIQSGRRKAIWKVSSDGTVVDRIPGVARAPSVLDRGVGEGGLETLGAGF